MRRTLNSILITLTLLLALAALTLGPSDITVGETLSILLGKGDSGSRHYIIWQLRLPRILASMLTGAVLGFSGAIFQAALRNPMADPFILGVSSGASFGVAIALALGLSSLIGFPVAALIGSVATTLAILALSFKRKGATTTLLLTGVAINYILSAAMTLLMVMNREQYQRILYWSLGSFSTATYSQVVVIAGAALLLFIPLSAHRASTCSCSTNRRARRWALGIGGPPGRPAPRLDRHGNLCLLLWCHRLHRPHGPHVSRLLVGPKHKHLLLPPPSSAHS